MFAHQSDEIWQKYERSAYASEKEFDDLYPDSKLTQRLKQVPMSLCSPKFTAKKGIGGNSKNMTVTEKGCNINWMLLPIFSSKPISHSTMNVTALDNHSPVKPPPTKDPSVEDVLQDIESE